MALVLPRPQAAHPLLLPLTSHGPYPFLFGSEFAQNHSQKWDHVGTCFLFPKRQVWTPPSIQCGVPFPHNCRGTHLIFSTFEVHTLAAITVPRRRPRDLVELRMHARATSPLASFAVEWAVSPFPLDLRVSHPETPIGLCSGHLQGRGVDRAAACTW